MNLLYLKKERETRACTRQLLLSGIWAKEYINKELENNPKTVLQTVGSLSSIQIYE